MWLGDTGVEMPKVPAAPGCSLLGTQHLPRTSQHPQHHSGYEPSPSFPGASGSASPTDSCKMLLQSPC